jgi:hypothetical protein
VLADADEDAAIDDGVLINQGSPAPAPPVSPPSPPPPAAPPPKPTACAHPVNPKSTQIAKDLDFGLRVRVNWESSTSKLSDLVGVFVTENITYSTIPNPPFGKADGKPMPESGQTQRIPSGDGLAAEKGVAQDTHRHPRGLVRSPASTGSYTVAQTYDYRGGACGNRWTPFAHYTIKYSIYDKGGSLRFNTHKVGTDGPFESDEAI